MLSRQVKLHLNSLARGPYNFKKTQTNSLRSYISKNTIINSITKKNLFNNNINKDNYLKHLTETSKKDFSLSKNNINLYNLNLEELNTDKKGFLKTSLIRGLDIGKNYFSQINPRRKKILMTLINSYIKALKTESEIKNFQSALDLYYKDMSDGKKFFDLEDKELDFPTSTLWHLNSLFCLDRFATSYCRFEYMDYPSIIEKFNSIPKEQINRTKFVFTLHPNMPNSTKQTSVFYDVVKAIEENDLDYLDMAMEKYIEACKSREFTKPDIYDEYFSLVSKALPNMIEGIGMAYEAGCKNLSNFYEIPGFYVEYSIINFNQNNAENQKKIENFKDPYVIDLGYVSFVHSTNMKLTLNHYLEIINEAKIIASPDSQESDFLAKILEEIKNLKNYCNQLNKMQKELYSAEISNEEFIENYPKINIEQSETNLYNFLEQLESCSCDSKVKATAKKLKEIFKIFKSKGASIQVLLPARQLDDLATLDLRAKMILEEIKQINENGNIIDMLVLSEYTSHSQYENLKNYVRNNLKIKGNLELTPRIDNFSSTNDTDSKITFIASSDTRKNDGLLLTELRVLRENNNNPSKYIFLGQGTTSERGGGPYKLIHQKYKSLAKSLRERHIRTVQGFYFASEFISKDLAFTFLLNGTQRINTGENFNPDNEYLDFLFELDSVIGVPQREMQKSAEWNDLYVKNPLIKTLVELYDYSGSKDVTKPLAAVKAEKAVVQAYINSDRCSYMHPEFAYWDRVPEKLKKKIIKYYYDNNRHFKYVLFVYAFMVKRFDLEFAIQEVGVDASNKYFQDISKGKKALEEILIKLGLGPESSPLNGIYNQHLGLTEDANAEESFQKERAYKMAFMLQNYQVKKYLKEKKIGLDFNESEYKIKILQSALSNVSQFNGKG